MTFWSDFWPNLASTIVGVVVGVPLGLWINRKAAGESERQRKRADQTQIAHALEVLHLAIRHNRGQLQGFASALSEAKTIFDAGIDYSTWDAVQGSLTAELRDPALRQRLAYHFQRLGALVKLNDMYLRFTIGVDASMTSSGPVRQALRTALTTVVAQLDAEAGELETATSTARTRLLAG